MSVDDVLSVAGRVKKALDETNLSPDAAAKRVAATMTQGEIESFAFTHLHRLASELYRDSVRAAEVKIEERGESVASAVANRDPVIRDRMFYAPGFGWVVWEKATIEQHRARAVMQRELAGKCNEDAERHEEAIRMIEQAKVKCLAEIGQGDDE